MKQVEKECAGKCPKCGSWNIDWHSAEIQDEFVAYPATCDDCDTDFSEWYALNYTTSMYEEK